MIPNSDKIVTGFRHPDSRPVLCQILPNIKHLRSSPDLGWKPKCIVPLCSQDILIMGEYPKAVLWRNDSLIPAIVVDERETETTKTWPNGMRRDSNAKDKINAPDGSLITVKMGDTVSMCISEEFYPEEGTSSRAVIRNNDSLKEQSHPWRSNARMVHPQELVLPGEEEPISIPGSPWTCIHDAGIQKDQPIIAVSLDELVTMFFKKQHAGVKIHETTRRVYIEDSIPSPEPALTLHQSKVTVCMTMIVKNEGKILRRSLEGGSKLADCYCICDTGSTDDTIEVAKAFFKEKGCPYRIFSHPFRDFGYSRTVSWLAGRGMATYQMFLDADHVLETGELANKDMLKHPSYLSEQTTHGCKYWNLRLAKDDSINGCEGVTHEHWSPKPNMPPLKITGISITDIGDGGAKSDKFTRDRMLLERQLLYTPDCSRTWFYLANTMRDQGEFENAVKAYEKRVELGGWPEEVWCSNTSMGRCLLHIGREKEAVSALLDAHNDDPIRVENLLELIMHYRKQKKYVLAARFCELALSNIKVRDANPRLLFVEEAVYTWRVIYELTIMRFYLGDAGKHLDEITHQSFFRLLAVSPIPTEHLIKNQRFYLYSPEITRSNTQALDLKQGPKKGKFLWCSVGPSPKGIMAICGWEDQDGKTNLVWNESGMDPSVIAVMDKEASSIKPPTLIFNDKDHNNLIMIGKKETIVYKIWHEHRKLMPECKSSSLTHDNEIAFVGCNVRAPKTWVPFSAKESKTSSLPWRDVKIVGQANQDSNHPWFLLRIGSKAPYIYSVMSIEDPDTKSPGVLSRAFEINADVGHVVGFWIDTECITIASGKGSKISTHSIKISNLIWMPSSECV